MRARHGFIAATIAAALVLIPVGSSPAQAADTLRSFGCISTIDPKCAGANLPILVEAGIISGGGATAATGATAAVAGTSAAGTLGFGTLVGASGAAVGLGLLKLYGVDDGMYIDTDPAYGGGVVPGQGATVTWNGHTVTGYLVTYATTRTVACFVFDSSASASYSVAGGVGTDGFWVATGGGAGAVRPALANSSSVADVCVSSTGAPRERIRYGSDWTTLGVYGWGNGCSCSNVPVAWFEVSTDQPQPGAGYHGTIRTRLECIAPGWTAPTTIVGSARVDVEQGGRLPVPPVSCDPPSVARSAVVEYQADGSTDWVALGSGDATATVSTLVDDYPSCFSSTGATLCELQLQRLDGSSWATCGPLAEYCPSWVTEWSETPDLFRCRFGSYTVDMSRCSAFREPGLLLPNVGEDADADGQPDALPPSAPVPEQLPNPVVDDTTGEPVPLPADVPGADDQPRECWPSGFGVFNPLSWVLMPIRCAFEPSPEKVREFRDTIRDRWEGSTPGVIVGGVAAAVAAAGAVVGAGGCSGVEIPTGWLNRDAFADAGFPESFHILDACPGSPLQPWAAFSFVLLSGAMIVLALRVVPGMVGRLVNFGGVSG